MSDVERATGTIDTWLRQEVVESALGRNQYLDDFEATRTAYAMPVGAEAAHDAAKNVSHHNRYKNLLGLVDEEALRHEDRLVAKLIHHSLMFTSGGFRTESILRAGSQEDYERLRFRDIHRPNGATGVEIATTIAPALQRWIGWQVDVDTYIDINHALNDGIRRNNVSIYEWFCDNHDQAFDPLAESDEPVEAAIENQRAGLVLAATHIAVATTLRDGDMRLVPFLEAKSITDASPDPIYPMAS